MDHKSPLWKVFTEVAFTHSNPALAAPELARQIEERIHAEGRHMDTAIVAITPDQKAVVVRCDDEFGVRLNDLPGASYAVQSKAQSTPAPVRIGA